jgi:hypothetical protein
VGMRQQSADVEALRARIVVAGTSPATATCFFGELTAPSPRL